jgi:hypothetical protein
VDDPGPLAGDDLTSELRHPSAFGITVGRSGDGTPTVEFTTDPDVQGAHGGVRVQRAAPTGRRLFARVGLGRDAWATCQSDDSIRVWGRFAPDVELELRSAEAVRVVARTSAGAVLAGPILLPPEASAPVLLRW